jgi:hypothetical protein
MKKPTYSQKAPTGEQIRIIRNKTCRVLSKSWQNVLDGDAFEKSGTAVLYQNHGSFYIYEENQNLVYYWPDIKESDFKNSLFNKQPFAYGITAFLSYDIGFPSSSLKSLLADDVPFETLKHFNSYLDQVSKRIFISNNKSPFPKSDEEISHQLYKEHLVDEKISLERSYRFYEKGKDDTDFELNTKVREYASAYIAWIKEKLNGINIPIGSGESTSSKKYPDKWYALLHAVLIFLGKEQPFTDQSRKIIEEFGKNKYGTGQQFYRELINIDLTRIPAYVRSFSPKDRTKWKDILIEVSGHDADIISWTRKQPI